MSRLPRRRRHLASNDWRSGATEQEVPMPLMNPGNIPVAARDLADIEKNSQIADIVGYVRTDALASKTNAPYDGSSPGVRPTLRGYKAVWQAAVRQGLVDAADSIDAGTGTVDIDHVFPKCWTNLPGHEVNYMRLFPVWREVNRSAGGGRERLDPHALGAERREGLGYWRTRSCVGADLTRIRRLVMVHWSLLPSAAHEGT